MVGWLQRREEEITLFGWTLGRGREDKMVEEYLVLFL